MEMLPACGWLTASKRFHKVPVDMLSQNLESHCALHWKKSNETRGANPAFNNIAIRELELFPPVFEADICSNVRCICSAIPCSDKKNLKTWLYPRANFHHGWGAALLLQNAYLYKYSCHLLYAQHASCSPRLYFWLFSLRSCKVWTVCFLLIFCFSERPNSPKNL